MTVRTLLAVVVAGVLAVPAMAAEIRPDPNKTGGSVEYHTPVQVCGHSSEHRHFSNALRDEVLADATDCHRDRIPIMKSTTLCPSALAAAMTCPTSGHSHAATSN